MDRFIAIPTEPKKLQLSVFKIQYGQIYSMFITINDVNAFLFKIQYGQIYRARELTTGITNLIFKIQYGQIYRASYIAPSALITYLKSNMDRFIGMLSPFTIR